jgi:putative endonuclease
VVVGSYWVYILASEHRTLYTGITNDLDSRIIRHREGVVRFTRKYNIYKLVYFEEYADPVTAITREKQIKAWTRAKRVALIESVNPNWRDLSLG